MSRYRTKWTCPYCFTEQTHKDYPTDTMVGICHHCHKAGILHNNKVITEEKYYAIQEELDRKKLNERLIRNTWDLKRCNR